MPSPFPGMDPYLEDPARWADFHVRMITRISEHLNAVLPPQYAARIDRHVYIHEPTAEERVLLGRPDVYVAGPPAAPAGAPAAPAVAPPVTVVMPAEARPGTRFIQILDVLGHRVVTAVELLSPSNKATGPDRNAYLAERG